MEQINSALESVSDTSAWALSDEDLENAIAMCESSLAKLYELRARLFADADGRDLGRRSGASSTQGWLRGRFRLRPGDARRQLHLAHRLTAAAEAPVDYAANVGSTVTGREMPATARALAEGEISVDHGLVIERAMGRIPKHVSVDQAQQAERDLAGLAREYDPGMLEKLADFLLGLLDADTLDKDEDERHRARDLRLNERTGAISGRLDAEGMATVRTALESLAKPNPAADGTPDPRSAGQRRADALVELARRLLSTGDLPAHHGTPPQLLIIAGLETLADDHHCTDTATGPADVGAQETPGNDGSDDCPLTAAAAAAHAAGGIPPGEVLWGGAISPAVVRRIGCYAGIRRVVLDPAGAVLDVGRQYRTITPAQHAALIARDGGCAFPGCTRPAQWCIAHHIIHWADGGKTDLDNLVLLCGYHHTTVHHRGWDVRTASDRLPEFLPPPWIDPGREPRRNNRPRHYTRPRAPT